MVCGWGAGVGGVGRGACIMCRMYENDVTACLCMISCCKRKDSFMSLFCLFLPLLFPKPIVPCTHPPTRLAATKPEPTYIPTRLVPKFPFLHFLHSLPALLSLPSLPTHLPTPFIPPSPWPSYLAAFPRAYSLSPIRRVGCGFGVGDLAWRHSLGSEVMGLMCGGVCWCWCWRVGEFVLVLRGVRRWRCLDGVWGVVDVVVVVVAGKIVVDQLAVAVLVVEGKVVWMYVLACYVR